MDIFSGIFDCVDDTKFVGKAVIAELTENMEQMLTNKYCVRWIFNDKSKQIN